MTTSKETLERFAENSRKRSEILDTAISNLVDIANDEAADEFTRCVANEAVANIALVDSKNEQAEIANLIRVTESPLFSSGYKREAVDRVIILLGLEE